MKDTSILIIGNGLNYSLKDELKTNISTNNFLNWNFVKYDLKTYFPTLYKKLQKEDKETNDFKKIENILLSTNSIIQEKKKISVELEKKYNISYEHENIAYNFLKEKEKTYNNCLLQLLEKFNVHGEFRISDLLEKCENTEKTSFMTALNNLEFAKKIYKTSEENYESVSESYYKFQSNNLNLDNYNLQLIKVKAEIEHYIVMSFSKYQEIIDKSFISKFSDWNWVDFINRHRNEIKVIVSLNYDLVIESILDFLNIKYFHYSIQIDNGGIAIIKPHGSINYIQNDNLTHITYPLNNVFSRNISPKIYCLKKEYLLEPRLEVNIVPPTQYTELLNFPWVNSGYKYIRDIGSTINKIIIGGVSYWECDKPEIDTILECINSNAQIININPNINSALEKTIESIFSINNYISVKDIKDIL